MVDGSETNSELGVKLLQAKSALSRSSGAVQIVAVGADYDFDPNEAVPSLNSFMESATSAVTGDVAPR